MTFTPTALPCCSSYNMECTTESGRKVILPVFAAHGNVDALELKYPPKGQPRWQSFRFWHWVRPCCKWIGSGLETWAQRAEITFRPGYFDSIVCLKYFSTTFSGYPGRNSPSGSSGRPSL